MNIGEFVRIVCVTGEEASPRHVDLFSVSEAQARMESQPHVTGQETAFARRDLRFGLVAAAAIAPQV